LEEIIMFAVIFEVQPKRDHWDDYLGLARQLRPRLEAIDGFIDNERFGSKKSEGRVLSLSTWRDEKSVVRWRTQGEHHAVQRQGRTVVFNDYHLRVGEIISDTAPPNGLVVEGSRSDETEIGDAKICTITEIPPVGATLSPDLLPAHLGLNPHADGLLNHELFESITNPGKLLILGSWRSSAAANAWEPRMIEGSGGIRHRHVRVIRDYGMFDRREAPQFYPAVIDRETK
jgi:heme-degrading monooxygenase HmoA